MNRRLFLSAGVAIGLAATFLPLVFPPAPVLIWNATASAPVGLYRTIPEPDPRVGDLVFVRPPTPLAAWLAAAGFLPRGALLLKRIAAAAPSVVCRARAVVTVDGRPAASALDRDSLGRPLPLWAGCRRLASDELFLLNAEPRSLDSRYFGPLPAALVVGRASQLVSFALAAHAP